MSLAAKILVCIVVVLIAGTLVFLGAAPEEPAAPVTSCQYQEGECRSSCQTGEEQFNGASCPQGQICCVVI